MATRAFDPRRAAEQHHDLVVTTHPIAALMGGGLYARSGGVGVIVVDPELDATHRRAVLTHELIHHERGGGIDRAGLSDVLARFVDDDERAVDLEVARRLVPPAELEAYLRSAVAAGAGVGAADVADEFEVPLAVAVTALGGVRPAIGGAASGAASYAAVDPPDAWHSAGPESGW